MASVTPGCGKRHRHQEDCWTGDPHIFLVLTKRPNRMFQVLTEVLPNYVGEFFPGDSPLCSALEAGRWPLANVWLGVTVEDQEQADKRIPLLLQAPATLRFLSVEPMLGRIALEQSWWKGSPPYLPWHGAIPNTWLHWVICGGESGPRSKPMHPDWVRNLRDQCQEARVPFFFKQWGEWAPDCFCQTLFPHKNIPRPEPGRMGIMFRCGKKAAGRLLDGRTWDEMPFIENPL
jgi:protein gp37